jgi:hypothetical protein
MALAFLRAMLAQPIMPMRTVYGDASIIARAAIDASRAAIPVDGTAFLMGQGCLTRRGSVQASAGGRGVSLSLLSTRNKCSSCTYDPTKAGFG